MSGADAADRPLALALRERVETAPGSGQFQTVCRQEQWDVKKTAVVICDMWDRHWCRAATARVAEMVPRMNEVAAALRAQGALVIHCPSDTMAAYADWPQRQRAQAAPRVELKPLAAGWCPRGGGTEPALPFDNSADRCDCVPQCPHGNPWRRQIATLAIAPEDAITDNAEAIYLLRQRGIANVLVMGVHANMCVLGRPFSIRALSAQGFRVALVRDLTDCIRDSQQPPAVSHARATDLVVEHIEQYWCPSVTSGELLDRAPFAFAADRRPHVVFVVGEDEYETSRTLPDFADVELAPRDARVTFVHARADDPLDFPGTAALEMADVLVLSVRRRTLPAEQLARIRAFVAAGKPLVGIRTASHAFALRDGKPPAGHVAWPEFDAEVLGGNYAGHHGAPSPSGPDTFVRIEPAAAGHAILAGLVPSEVRVTSSLYKTSPLAPSCRVLAWGRVDGVEQPEPVAWTNEACGRRVFYTSLGNVDDFNLPLFRGLLLNGIYWALERPVPERDD